MDRLMPTYAFKCKTCGSEFESPVGGDRMESCRNEECDGIPVRVWSVSFAKVPGGNRRGRS